MSKNLKTLLCCVLSLVFVAGTIVAVFADSNSLFATETESATNEEVTAEETTVAETTTAPEVEDTTEAPVVDDTTVPSVEDTTDAPVVDDTTVTTTEPVEDTTDAEPEFRLGDVNFDGKITAADARLALRFSAKVQIPTAEEFIVADVITDGIIYAADARLILRVSARIASEADFGKAA